MPKKAFFIILSFVCVFAYVGQLSANDSKQDIHSVINSEGHARLVVSLKPSIIKFTNLSEQNKMVENLQASILTQLKSQTSYKLIHRYQSVPGLALDAYDISIYDILKSMPEVTDVSLDQGGHGGLDQSRPWIGADVIQNLGISGEGVTIAVLDTGFDSSHSALAGSLDGEYCICTNCCPNGSSVQIGAGSAEDDHGHGTHVAGIITANGNGSPVGIAPDAKILAVKVLNSSNSFDSSSNIVAAMDWVLNNRSDVKALSMSLGTSAEYDGYCDNKTAWTQNYASVVNSLNAQGILTIVSSGNSYNANGMGVPACLSGSVAVGASFSSSDFVVNFSNSSSALDILAPGSSITSSKKGGGSVQMSGTSMAAPHVTAVLALMTELYPNTDASLRKSCLLSSSVMITDYRNNITRPRLDSIDAIVCLDRIFADGFE